MDNFVALLHRHQLRITEPRTAVFNAVQSASNALSFADIANQCPGVNRSSIYRTIDTCLAIGVLRVINIGWKKRYELTDLFQPHHHHLICTSCEKVITIQEEELERFIDSIAKRHDFTPTSHQFEIEGYCQQCQAQRHATTT